MYGWLNLVSERNFVEICKFYVIYHINVIVVILESHVRCHCLCMGS
jgi:hypothetical protein